MPRYDLYWSTEMRYPSIADVMSRDRFKEIIRYMHFNDNTKLVKNREDPAYDRLFKVRQLLTKLRAQCLLLDPEEKESIDEQMIPFNGKNKLRVYLPKKPKKWRFKVFARCGVSGIVYDFYVYDGKKVEVMNGTGNGDADVVIKLCESLPIDCYSKINYSTTFEMQKLLMERNIMSVGTVRQNRLQQCPLKSESELRKLGIFCILYITLKIC